MLKKKKQQQLKYKQNKMRQYKNFKMVTKREQCSETEKNHDTIRRHHHTNKVIFNFKKY